MAAVLNKKVVIDQEYSTIKKWKQKTFVFQCKLLHLEWIDNKVLLYSTGNYIHSPGINHNGKEYYKKNVYMCRTESLCCTAEIGTAL